MRIPRGYLRVRGAAAWRSGARRGAVQRAAGSQLEAVRAGQRSAVNMGPHLAPATILLANIALSASELSAAGRYYCPCSLTAVDGAIRTI